MLADCRSAGNANAFLKNHCGIDLSNTDTGAITGKDAGGSTVKTKNSVVPESGSITSSASNSFTANGLTVQLAKFDSQGNPYDISYSSLDNDRQKYIWRALQTWWAKNSLNLIAESYGDNYSFNSSGSTANKLSFGFFNEDSGTMAVTKGWFADSEHKTINKLAMKVNMNNYSNLTIGDKDGKISGSNGFYLDRVIAHEFTHAIMYANINYIDDLPNFIMEGMAELTHGTDDDRSNEILSLAKNSSSLQNALNYDVYESYAGGYMFLRYLAKQGSEHYPSSIIGNDIIAIQSKSVGTASGSAGVSVKGALLTVTKDFANDMLDLADYSSKVKTVNAKILSKGTMIVGNRNANSISAGSSNDTVFGNTGNDTISGNKGNDRLYGDAGNDKLYGNVGNDTLNGGTGNDTLTGGDGKNVFIFGTNAGKDVIVDYTVGKDKIKFVENGIISSSVKGSDVIFNLGQDDSITVKGVKGKKITVIDKNGKETSKVYPLPTTLTVTNSTKSPVTVDSAIKTINASKRTIAVKITGNALANTISGGSNKDTINGGAGNDSIVGNAGNDNLHGGEGNDTLTGGKGNDMLWGDAGADKFIYVNGDGKDTIYGFDNTDMLQITGAFSNSYSKSKKEIYFKIGSTANAITLSDFSATSFNVNGTNYKISGSKLVKK